MASASAEKRSEGALAIREPNCAVLSPIGLALDNDDIRIYDNRAPYSNSFR